MVVVVETLIPCLTASVSLVLVHPEAAAVVATLVKLEEANVALVLMMEAALGAVVAEEVVLVNLAVEASVGIHPMTRTVLRALLVLLAVVEVAERVLLAVREQVRVLHEQLVEARALHVAMEVVTLLVVRGGRPEARVARVARELDLVAQLEARPGRRRRRTAPSPLLKPSVETRLPGSREFDDGCQSLMTLVSLHVF